MNRASAVSRPSRLFFPRHTISRPVWPVLAVVLAALLQVACLPAAHADFQYPDFSSTAGLQLNGDTAAVAGSCGCPRLRLLAPAAPLPPTRSIWEMETRLARIFSSRSAIQAISVTKTVAAPMD